RAVRRRVLRRRLAAEVESARERFRLRLPRPSHAHLARVVLLHLGARQAARRGFELLQPRQSAHARNHALARQPARHAPPPRLPAPARAPRHTLRGRARAPVGTRVPTRNLLEESAALDTRGGRRLSRRDALPYERLLPVSPRDVSRVRGLAVGREKARTLRMVQSRSARVARTARAARSFCRRGAARRTVLVGC